MNNIEMKMKELRNLSNERDRLLNDLGRSMALQNRFPGCFDNGKCRVLRSSTYPHKFPEDFSITVEVNGEVFKLSGSHEPETVKKICPDPGATGGEA